MKKNTKKLIFALVVLIILAGATALLMLTDSTEKNQNTLQTGDYKTYTVFSDSIDNIKEVSIIFGEGSIQTKKDAQGNWLINNLSLSDIDKSKSGELVQSAINIISTSLISEESANLSEYGLDTPKATIIITKNDGNVEKVLIGNASPVNGEYFVKNEADTAVYTISDYKFKALTNQESYYTEFERFVISDVYAINEIIIERESETIALSKAEENTQSYYDAWNMTSPINTPANDDYIHDYVIEKIRTISLTSPIPDGDFGFDKPTATLTLKICPYDEENQKYGEEYIEKLTVGKMTESKYYVHYKGKAYQVQADTLEFINSTVLNLSSKLQALFKISDVERVDMLYGGESHTLDIIHLNDSGDYSFKIDGKDIDPDDAKKLYQKLIGALANGLYKGGVLSESMLTLKYKGYNGAKDNIVEFKPLNDLECAIVKNGNAQFTVNKSTVSELIKAIISATEL